MEKNKNQHAIRLADYRKLVFIYIQALYNK